MMIEFTTYHPNGAGHVLVVELSGKLDTDSADAFFRRLEEELGKGHVNLIFDCKNLNHISSLGFGMMIRAHSRVQTENGVVRFSRLEGVIEEAFNVVGFNKLFENYSSIDVAVASFA
jgi:anti-sigma B factor antagonist